MSHGKEAARDLRYGRRGGRWAGTASGHVDKVLVSIHAERMKAIRHDLDEPEDAKDPTKRKWPVESIELWKQIADNPDHPSYLRALDVVEALAGGTT